MCFSIARFYKKVSETAVLTHTRKVLKSHYNRINRKEESQKINFWSGKPFGFSNASGLQGQCFFTHTVRVHTVQAHVLTFCLQNTIPQRRDSKKSFVCYLMGEKCPQNSIFKKLGPLLSLVLFKTKTSVSDQFIFKIS